MKNILFFTNFIFIFTFAKSDSPYKCSNIYKCSKTDLPQNQCLYVHPISTLNNTVLMHEINNICTNETKCVGGEDTNRTCLHVKPTNLVHNSPCYNNTDCASNKCNSNKCLGLGNMEVCISNEQCATGYYCGFALNGTTKNCLTQKNSLSTCNSDFECINSNGCNLINNTCINYFTLEDGEKSTNMLLCKSGFIYLNYCVSTSRFDDEECLETNGIVRSECRYNFTGMPINVTDTVSFSNSCKCSKNFENRKFCDLGTSSSEWQKLLVGLKDHYNYHADKLHTTIRGKYELSLAKLYLITFNHAAYKDADSCITNFDAFSYNNRESYLLLIFLLYIGIL